MAKLPKQFQIVEHATHARMIYNSSVFEQLPYILIYPLRGHALPLLIIFSFILWITLDNMLGLPAFIIIMSAIFKYAYSVLENTILGYSIPPTFTLYMCDSSNQRPFKQLIYLLIIFGVFTILQTRINDTIAYLFLTIGIFLTPASAIVIANKNSLIAAINPLRLFILLKQIGAIYIFISLLFSLFILLGLQILPKIPLLSFFVPQFSWLINNHFLLLLIVILDMYLLFMIFHLLGFVIYHRHEFLGFEVIFSPQREEDARQQAKNKQFTKSLDEIYWLTRQGRQQEAIKIFLAKLPILGNQLDDHQELFERVSVWETSKVALVHGQHYLTLLFRKKRLTKVLAIYKACLALDNKFKPKNCHQVLLLAKQAYSEKQYTIALDLLQDYPYQENSDIVEIKLLTVKLLTEQFKQFKEAKIIMVQLLKNKEHRLYPEVKKYANFLVKYAKARNKI